jgi:hypothetical protein
MRASLRYTDMRLNEEKKQKQCASAPSGDKLKTVGDKRSICMAFILVWRTIPHDHNYVNYILSPDEAVV